MIVFAVAVVLLLALAAILSRSLSRRDRADTLGLKAARAAVVADMHRRIYVSRRQDRIAHHAGKAQHFAEVYGVRALAVLRARTITDKENAA